MEQPLIQPRKKPGPFSRLRTNFLAGLVVIAPIAFTLWLIWTVMGWVDGWVLPFVPDWLDPEQYIGINLRGVGVIFFLVFTVFVGWIAKGLVGRSFIRFGEGLVGRMPVVRSVYNAVKQISETVFAQSDTNFDKACLIEHPRKGVYAIAFITTDAKGEIDSKLPHDERIVSVFMPTTPNPTSGFLLFLPHSDIIELDMTVEDAAKLIISAGLVYPSDKDDAPEGAIPLRSRRRARDKAS